MTQRELDEEIAAATGESVRTIRRRGFSLMVPLKVFDPDEGTNAEPQTVDWDAVQQNQPLRAA